MAFAIGPGSCAAEPEPPPPDASLAPVASFPGLRLAQFQLPQNEPREGAGPARQEARELAKDLAFQYSFGSDTEYTYSRNADLNPGLRDNLQILAPTLFFLGTMRPNPWVAFNLGFTWERQVRIHEETITRLPDGERVPEQRRGSSGKFDVANVVIKTNGEVPIEFTFGRRDFEDPRLFLYDTSLDGLHVKLKLDTVNSTEVSFTRENQWDLAYYLDEPRSSIRNLILYHEYKGFEDHTLAGYAIARLDRLPQLEGRPKLYGVRAYGKPSDELRYWSEFGIVHGVDEAAATLRGTAVDVGGVYRFTDRPYTPCLTVAFAYGSGDANSRDRVNREYRQTGLQSNETKLCGVAQFKRYGEFLDPELSNLRIWTVGIGFRPAANVYVDVVHHAYQMSQAANDIRNSAPTAELNRLPRSTSKDVGREMDVVIALRRLFETKWGIDLRAGLFSPGSAYLRNDGTNRNPSPRKPNRGLNVLAVLSY